MANDPIEAARQVAAMGEWKVVPRVAKGKFNILRDGFLAADAELAALVAIGIYIRKRDEECDDSSPCHLSYDESDRRWYFCDWEFYPEHLGMGGDSFIEHYGSGVEILAEIERLKGHRAELQADWEKEQEDD